MQNQPLTSFDTTTYSVNCTYRGIEGRLWNVIYSLHNNIVSAIKWEGQMSTPFKVTQGVRQGGILSADLYKVYVNDLLDRMLHSNIGGHIGNIPCNAPTCADDMSSLSGQHF